MTKKKAIFYFVFTLFLILFSSCGQKENNQDIIKTNDTIKVLPEGEFTYNLPCRVVYIHQEKEGKSVLFVWLHGGVHDRRLHDFGEFNHLQCTEADDNILKYLREKEVKSIVLFPICHKAESVNCVTWKDCFTDIKWMIDDYINKDLVDSKRIYLGGSSDGGVGTWDFLEIQENLFAAAMPMSCANPRKTSIPVYFFNTNSESDCSDRVNALNKQGCKIEYKHCTQYKHGGDGDECTFDFLDMFFSNINN